MAFFVSSRLTKPRSDQKNITMPSALIAPSLLSADFLHLERDIEMVNSSQADWLHLDVMDGSFVPNISFGFPIVKAASKISTKPLDVHLMIVNPDKYLHEFKDAGAHILTVHLEACTHLHRSIQAIKSLGCKSGVAINPHTPVTALFDVLEDVDVVCLMSVNPGFGGQKFIYRSIHKIKQLKEEIISRNLNTKIEVDGGVGRQNAEVILQAGADILIAGNAIFGAEHPTEEIKHLKSVSVHTYI